MFGLVGWAFCGADTTTHDFEVRLSCARGGLASGTPAKVVLYAFVKVDFYNLKQRFVMYIMMQ